MAHRKKISKRYRLRFNFWLNVLNKDEEMVADQIELLKNDRQFAGAIRDGIMLISELRRGETSLLTTLFDWLRKPIMLWNELQQGRIEMLLELFPAIVAKIATPSPVPSADIVRMQSELDYLKQLILAQQRAPQVQPSAAPRPLTLPTVAPPPDDDEPLAVTRDETAGARSAQNFLASCEALQEAR